MKVLLVIILTMSLMGCSSLLNVRTTIEDPDGRIWKVESKSDALVQVKSKDAELVVDNRGRPSVLETMIGLAVTNTNVNLGLSNKAQEVNQK
jgi:hypothetical protein